MARVYRILLVDDEEEVRTSILKKIDWEGTGFAIVGDAENGQDALEKIELYEPDVVLTDIRMPYMDGLTLAETLRQTHPSIKVVIFSGFDDFEYAKQAIRLNILEYILKPVNAEELTAILTRIHETLDEETRQIRDVHTLRESFVKNLPILKENFLNNLIRGAVDEIQIPSLLREYRIDIGEAQAWTVAQVLFGMAEGQSPLERELQPLSVKQLIDRYFDTRCPFASFHSSAGLCIVIGLTDEQKLSEIITVLMGVCRESRKVLELPLTIGVGVPRDSLGDLEPCYREAHEAAGYRAMTGAVDVICISDVEHSPSAALALSGKSESDLVAALKFGEPGSIRSAVEAIVFPLREARVHQSRQQVYIIAVMDSVLRVVQRYELDEQIVFGGKTDYYEILSSLRDADSLQKFLVHTCSAISAQINAEREGSAQGMVRDAKQYIAEHYASSSLSLEIICGHLHISTTYFSTVFKREAGESYTTYLTRVRMEKAAELLGTTDMKTYMVAKAVGYDEPNYFSYVFKKQYGVTPNRYRGK